MIHKILVSRGLFMNLLKSVPKNKSSVFNGLQDKMTGSNPVALTTFPNLNSGNKYNDLASNSLKTLPNLKHLIRRWSEYTLITICKIRSKLPTKSIKVSCKCLVDFSKGDRLFTKRCLVNNQKKFNLNKLFAANCVSLNFMIIM